MSHTGISVELYIPQEVKAGGYLNNLSKILYITSNSVLDDNVQCLLDVSGKKWQRLNKGNGARKLN